MKRRSRRLIQSSSRKEGSAQSCGTNRRRSRGGTA